MKLISSIAVQPSPPEVGWGGEGDLALLSITQGFICFNNTLWFLKFNREHSPRQDFSF